jgi:hypothetical protein
VIAPEGVGIRPSALHEPESGMRGSDLLRGGSLVHQRSAVSRDHVDQAEGNHDDSDHDFHEGAPGLGKTRT